VGHGVDRPRPSAGVNPYLVALMASVVVLIVLGALTVARASHDGSTGFYRADDSRFYRDVARDPFGDGRTIAMAGRRGEASYRYGRVLLPALAWATAAGQPSAVTATLILWNLVAFAAVVLFTGLLLHERGADPRWSVAVLLVPGLFLLMFQVYAEPLTIALLLAGSWLSMRGRRAERGAAACFAAAILARETAALVLVPFVWRALRKGDRAEARRWLVAAVPAAAWWLWVWVRVGQLPFLATTSARRGALSAPFVAIADFATDATQSSRTKIVAALVVTMIASVVAVRVRRWFPVSDVALAFTALVVCMGPTTLHYSQEAFRLLAVPQTFALVAIVGAFTAAPDKREVSQRVTTAR
jgi:hypothetical protein